MAEQVEEAVPEQVRRRLVPREEQENAVRDHLVVRQAVALVLRAEHETHQVVSRAARALAEERAEVVDQPGDAGARLGEVVALVDRPAEVGRQAIGPGFDRLEVLLRGAHQPGDDRRRQREGELPDEVHRATRDDAVEERVDGPLDAIAARLELFRRERALQEAPQAVVVGRVAEDEPVAQHVGDRPHRGAVTRVPVVDLAEAVGGERVGAVEDLDDVLEARDHPGVETLAPVHWVVVPEPGVEREWVLDVLPGLEIEIRLATGLAHRGGYYPQRPPASRVAAMRLAPGRRPW